MSIPPSRNKIRARVLQEQRFQPSSGSGSFMSPNKAVAMGRKLVTWDELKAVTQIRDLEGLRNAKKEDCMDDDLGEASPDITRGIACCTAPLALQLGQRWKLGENTGSRSGSGYGTSNMAAGNLHGTQTVTYLKTGFL
ncbi:unnamed protein product [Musa hybrid cultivar]